MNGSLPMGCIETVGALSKAFITLNMVLSFCHHFSEVKNHSEAVSCSRELMMTKLKAELSFNILSYCGSALYA